MINLNMASYGLILFGFLYGLVSCQDTTKAEAQKMASSPVIQPLIVTDTVPNDTDDPAIWINKANPEESLVVGTDKAENGGLYVFNLKGEMDSKKSIRGLNRPNNVDIEYGLSLNGKSVDIAVVTERHTHKLRIYQLPDMNPIDNGGIPVFVGDALPGYRDLMGISLYKAPAGNVYAIVGRKTGPTDGSYLWQYILEDNGKGQVKATLVRKFGKYSGIKEIESIAVDDRMGYVYYSDEGVGVRKYFADPAKGNEELALFAAKGFTEDNEGISIYETSDSTGYLLVSDQGADQFNIFPREGRKDNPHQHDLLRVVKVAAHQSDGSETVSVSLGNEFPRGLFVAMSDNKTFHYYKPETILGDSLLHHK